MKYFSNIDKIVYEGKESKNPLAFKYYNPDFEIRGKKMKDHLRFALSYWHTLTGTGIDMFGSGTMNRPWQSNNPMELAKKRVDAAFEIMNLLGITYFCFHDLDIAPEGNSLKERFENLDEIVEYIENKMANSSIKLLWGTSNAFTHPRFVHGAATAPNADVFAYAAAQVKKAMDITHRLKGENYVFWGGREGYETLLNTDMSFELENYARFLRMAVEYKERIGFKGQLLIEPKPKEPTKHQYDFDAATIIGFLRKYQLEKHFKLNIEANHATLAGHTFEHELQTSRINNMLGSIDANQGDDHLGWDTDQFPTNIYHAVYCMIEVLKNGGIAPGGLNFDAKLRRGSMDLEDVLIGYIVGMDTFAKGLLIADELLRDGSIDHFVKSRYVSYQNGIGSKIINKEVGFDELCDYALVNDQITNSSSKQEWLEALVNQAIMRG